MKNIKNKIKKIAAVIAAGILTTGILYTGYKEIKQQLERRARIENNITVDAAHNINIPNIDIIDGYNLEDNKYIILDIIKYKDIPAAEEIRRADGTHNTYYNLLINGKHKILILQGADCEEYPALLIDAADAGQNKTIDNIITWAYGNTGTAAEEPQTIKAELQKIFFT